MTKWVLDSSAILAMLDDEPGAERVRERLDGALISAVNLAEVIGKLCERGATPEQADLVISALEIPCETFDPALALHAGALRIETRKAGLSLGDRACLALAGRENASALTADRAWADLDIGVVIELIR